MNDEPEKTRQNEEENEEQQLAPLSLGQQAAVFVPTAAAVCGLDAVLHAPLPLAVAGLVGAYYLTRKSPTIYEAMREHLPLPALANKERAPGQWSLMDRLLDRHMQVPLAPTTTKQSQQPAAPTRLASQAQRVQPTATTHADEEEPEISFEGEDDDEEDLLPRPVQDGLFLFSSVLDHFEPTLDRIFLASTMDGRELTCHARELCHVALAGVTGGGKSSILRLLMLQLCRARVRVLLLNPHYTGYDLDNDEDWTPFEPYLVHPPMECRKYEVIAHYLKSAAKDLIPKRLERRAHSQPVGKPYFIVIDELPSIVREIGPAPDYMRIILEEGRKVGVYLISAAQDFLIRTIAPKAGGGSIRECYRTAYYVGGDQTTAKTLLDMPASLIQEDALGKGVAMLRAKPCKKAIQVRVPYVDNASLYRLLGPSTYRASDQAENTEQELARPDETQRQSMYAIYPRVNENAAIYQSVNELVNGSTGQSELHCVSDHLHVLHPSVNDDTRAQEEEKAPINGHINKLTARVSPETRKHIRAMVEMKKFNHADIARIVGLYGPKYKIYKQVCIEEGLIEKEAEA